MSKPEVVAEVALHTFMWEHPLLVLAWVKGQENKVVKGTQLIRLTDHEAARAADKARIAELEAANAINMPGLLEDLDEALEELALRGRHDDYGYQQLCAWYSKMRRVTRTVDAALTQQGKEGDE